MKTRKDFLAWGMLSLAMCMLTLSVPALAQQPTITTIDAPHAGSTSGYGTEAIAICPAGQVAGFYADYSNAVHAYLRTTDGKITTFDAPGAEGAGGAIPLPAIATPGTYAVAGDACGLVTGYVVDSRNVAHGYLRGADGTFTMFDVPGAGTGYFQGTFAGNMSMSGELIAGNYVDSTGMNHGFLRASNGTVTEFDVPAAAKGPGLGTSTEWAQCVNPAGAMTGIYFDRNGAIHGYVRNPDGTIATFDAPGAGTGSGQGTYAVGINPAGTVVGISQDNNGVYHGLLRTADGKITIFDIPAAGTGAGQGTQGEGINPSGVVVGYYTDANNVSHGYVRAVDGTFTFFDVPGAGTGSGQGTFPMTNNPAGSIVGFYVDNNGAYHGFVRK
jgi:probable HAF family extracellular repeat protein